MMSKKNKKYLTESNPQKAINTLCKLFKHWFILEIETEAAAVSHHYWKLDSVSSILALISSKMFYYYTATKNS